jgi:hypothetical protein
MRRWISINKLSIFLIIWFGGQIESFHQRFDEISSIRIEFLVICINQINLVMIAVSSIQRGSVLKQFIALIKFNINKPFLPIFTIFTSLV